MKKAITRILSILLIGYAFSGQAFAQCCSLHGGAVACDANSGRYICADGYISRCICTTTTTTYYFTDQDFDDFDGGYHDHHGHHYHYYYYYY